MGGIDFIELAELVGFATALYVGGWIFRNILHLPPALGEVVVGVLLGNDVVGLISKENRDFLQILGYIGVTLMTYESGMRASAKKMHNVWKRSLGIAILGTTLPILGGMLLVYAAYGYSSSGEHYSMSSDTKTITNTIYSPQEVFPSYVRSEDCFSEDQQLFPDGFSLGCALAPTAISTALRRLTESKQLDSRLGQTIITAASMNDALSLISLSVLIRLGDSNVTIWLVSKNILLSFVFLIMGTYTAFRYSPIFVGRLLAAIPSDSDRSLNLPHQVLLIIMFGTLVLYSWLSWNIGSHFLGSFIAGVTFSDVPRSSQVWSRQLKRIQKWLSRLFFGAVVGFSIPVSVMFTLETFYLGVLCAIGPCIIAKLVPSLIAESGSKTVVGIAMVDKREFAFLVAYLAKNQQYRTTVNSLGRYSCMLSEKVFAICMWGLLCTIILTPVAFQYCLSKLTAERAAQRAKSGRRPIFSFRLKVKGHYVPFIVHDVLTALKDMHLVADNSNVDTDGSVFMMTTTVQTKSQMLNDDLDDDAFHTIKHQLLEVLNDEDGQVMMVPIVVRRAVQLGQIKLFSPEGDSIDLSKCIAHNPGGDNPSASQGPEGALRISTESRWVDRNAKPLIIEFPTSTKIDKYTIKTAKDLAEAASEPVAWSLEGLLSDSDEWIILDVQEGVTVPLTRNTDYPIITLSECLAWKFIKFIPKCLSHNQGELTDISHVAGQRFRPGVHFTLDFHDEAHYVVIKVIGEHKVEFIVHMFNILQHLKLDIHKAKMYQTYSAGSDEAMSIKLLYCKDIVSAGTPSAERLAEIRKKLTRQFAIHGIKGKAMVKTLRCENAPLIYGFTPPVHEGEHVGEFVFVYKRRETTKSEVWCPLTAVLAWMHTELHFDIINLAMDRDVETSNSHVTIFVKDPEFSQHSDQENVVCDLIEIFQQKGVPAHVSAHLHEWHPDQDMVTTNLGEIKDGFKNTFARISDPKYSHRGASVKSFHGEVLSLASPDVSQAHMDDRFSRLNSMVESLRVKVNADVDAAVSEIIYSPKPTKRYVSPY